MTGKPAVPTDGGLHFPAAALLNVDPELPAATFAIIRTAMGLLSAARGPSLAYTGWVIVAGALAACEEHARNAAGGIFTSRGVYGVTQSKLMKRTGLAVLNKGVRWSLRQMWERRDEVTEWRGSLPARRRQHLNNPVDIWQAFAREQDTGKVGRRRTVAAIGQNPSLLEKLAILADHLEAIREQRDALEHVLRNIAGKTPPATLRGLSDELLRKMCLYLPDDVRDALRARLAAAGLL